MPERKKTCVEVEQKFSVPVRYRTVLETAGARLVSEKTLSDVYFDTEDLTLLRGDVWLRRRWEQVIVVVWWVTVFIVGGHSGS